MDGYFFKKIVEKKPKDQKKISKLLTKFSTSPAQSQAAVFDLLYAVKPRVENRSYSVIIDWYKHPEGIVASAAATEETDGDGIDPVQCYHYLYGTCFAFRLKLTRLLLVSANYISDSNCSGEACDVILTFSFTCGCSSFFFSLQFRRSLDLKLAHQGAWN